MAHDSNFMSVISDSGHKKSKGRFYLQYLLFDYIEVIGVKAKKNILA